MQLFSKFKTKIKYNTYFDLLSIGLIPTFLILICTIIIAILSFNSTKKQLLINTENTMHILSSANSEKINYAITTASVFVQDENLSSYLSNLETPLSNEIISSAKQSILNYTGIFTSVDNVFLFNQNANTILSVNGSYSVEDYFNMHYSYTDYPKDYWKKILFWDDSEFRTLSPTIASSVSGSKTVLPIIIRNINQKKLSAYIVINIDLDKLIESAPLVPTAPSKLYVLNSFYNKAISIPKTADNNTALPPELYSELLKKPNNTFNLNIDNKKYFIVSNTNAADLNGYIYYSITPFDELFKNQRALYGVIALQILIFTISAIFILYKKTKKFYSPIKSLGEKFSIDEKNINMANIKSYADSLIEQNLHLQSTLPYAQEKYLINYLNSAEYTFDKDTQNIMQQNLPFKHSLFACVVIRFSPTDDLFRTFSNEEYNNIQHGLYNTIKNLYSSSFNAFFLSSEQNSVYIILNLENTSQKSEISSTWEHFLKLLKNDTDYIKLYYGESDIHEDLTGLKLAHNQALENLTFVATKTTEPQIKLSLPKSLITKTDEAKLYNLLVSNETKGAKILIDSYKSKIDNSDTQTQKNFYSKVLGIILKVLQIKKIAYSDTIKNDYEFISEVLENNNMYDVIIELLEKINTQSNKKNTKNIIPYISENYSNSNISLEYIASIFQTNPSYVSAFIKNNLNIGFHEYLTGLRVTQSKTLLTETKMPISEIVENVGFPSRTTFFRSFKQDTGMTPSEFRKLYSRV